MKRKNAREKWREKNEKKNTKHNQWQRVKCEWIFDACVDQLVGRSVDGSYRSFYSLVSLSTVRGRICVCECFIVRYLAG